MFDCISDIADYYHVPPLLVESILKVEGGKVGSKIGPNSNGTYDLGVMQINTVWLPELKKFNIDENTLIYQPCVNIVIGTWILAKRYKEFDNDWTNAIRSYNAGYILKNGNNYARIVLTVWNELHAKQNKLEK